MSFQRNPAFTTVLGLSSFSAVMIYMIAGFLALEFPPPTQSVTIDYRFELVTLPASQWRASDTLQVGHMRNKAKHVNTGYTSAPFTLQFALMLFMQVVPGWVREKYHFGKCPISIIFQKSVDIYQYALP